MNAFLTQIMFEGYVAFSKEGNKYRIDTKYDFHGTAVIENPERVFNEFVIPMLRTLQHTSCYNPDYKGPPIINWEDLFDNMLSHAMKTIPGFQIHSLAMNTENFSCKRQCQRLAIVLGDTLKNVTDTYSELLSQKIIDILNKQD